MICRDTSNELLRDSREKNDHVTPLLKSCACGSMVLGFVVAVVDVGDVIYRVGGLVRSLRAISSSMILVGLMVYIIGKSLWKVF